MDKMKILEKWQTVINSSVKAQESASLLNESHRQTIVDALYTLESEYTRAISKVIGDEEGWLEWYSIENEMGKQGLKASARPSANPKPIRTLKALLQLIEGRR